MEIREFLPAGMSAIPVLLHEILSLTLWYSCFCRAVKMSINTHREVRLAFWMLSAVSVLSVIAPFKWGWQPDFLTEMLLTAIVILQIVTAVHWQHGIPKQFTKTGGHVLG